MLVDMKDQMEGRWEDAPVGLVRNLERFEKWVFFLGFGFVSRCLRTRNRVGVNTRSIRYL